MTVRHLGPRTDVSGLFPEEQQRLLGLLKTLSAAQWTIPTACPGWTVKDIAAHVLGDHLGRLSLGYPGSGPNPGEEFTAFIHRHNEEWVTATRRLPPLRC